MRILFHTYSLAFQAPGGGEQVMLELQKELVKRGHVVEFFNPWEHNPETFDLVHYFSVLESSTWRVFRKVHGQKPFFVTPTLAAPKGWRANLRLGKEYLVSFFRQNRFTDLKLPDHFFPTTSQEAKVLQKKFRVPSEKITPIPNGVARRFSEGQPSLFFERTGIPAGFVLHVGRFHPVKRQLFLIEALKGSKTPCVLIGNPDPAFPEYLQKCQRAAQGAPNIHILQGIRSEDPILASAYAAASVFALPSQFETFGMAALEAAVAGCPLVLSSGFADPTLFGAAAKFLPKENAEEWRKEIEATIQRGKLAPQLREELRKKFNWAKIAETIERTYLQTINRQ